MIGDLLFRMLFLSVFVPGVAIRTYYIRKIRAVRKRRSIKERFEATERGEGRVGLILLLAEGILLLVAVPLYLCSSPGFPFLELPIPDWLRLVGVGFGVFSLRFLAWVHYVLDRHWDVSLALIERHELVTNGPYQRIQHPMYTVHIVYFFTWVLVSANLLFPINYVLALLLILMRIPKEERMLLNQFGEEYRAYMKRTGRLLPPIRWARHDSNPS